MTKKEELVKELNNFVKPYNTIDGEYVEFVDLNGMAEFIIEERKRIVEPLVRIKKAQAWAFAWKDAGLEVLRNAGIELERN